jgi:hypothetical protein
MLQPRKMVEIADDARKLKINIYQFKKLDVLDKGE